MGRFVLRTRGRHRRSALSGFLAPALDPRNHGSLLTGAGVPSLDSGPFRVATVAGSIASRAEPSDPIPRLWLFDRQGWSTLLAGALLLLISFITNYGDDNLLHFGSIPAHDKVGMGLHLAALAALAGDVELATRLRHRAAHEAAEERNRAAAAREQATRRARIEARCLVAQSRFLLADTARNRLQLSEALAVLLEGGRRGGGG